MYWSVYTLYCKHIPIFSIVNGILDFLQVKNALRCQFIAFSRAGFRVPLPFRNEKSSGPKKEKSKLQPIAAGTIWKRRSKGAADGVFLRRRNKKRRSKANSAPTWCRWWDSFPAGKPRRLKAATGSFPRAGFRVPFSYQNEKSSGPVWGCCFSGAGGGTRTHTMSPSADFESATSTIPSHRHTLGEYISFTLKIQVFLPVSAVILCLLRRLGDLRNKPEVHIRIRLYSRHGLGKAVLPHI
jgi:hypothetical protein